MWFGAVLGPGNGGVLIMPCTSRGQERYNMIMASRPQSGLLTDSAELSTFTLIIDIISFTGY